MKKTLLLISVLFILINSNAQQGGGPPSIGVVSGIVKGQDGELVEYATVALKSKRDSSIVTGGITNDKGVFNISEIKLGRYTLIVEFIGYKGYESEPFGLGKNGITKDFGIIELKNSDDLAVVEAQAEDQLLQVSIDKKVFNADKNITSAGGTALDVLQNVPSVQVDQNGAVSLRGNQNVTVLIDGKPSGLTGSSRQALLEQIPASSIENIELITNPSAKYDPDGMSGIINIILKKNKLKGFTGMVSVQAGNGRLNQSSSNFSTINKYNLNGGLAYKNQKFNLYGNYTINLKNRFSEGAVFRESDKVDTNYTLNQESYDESDRNSNMLKAGFDYYLNKKNTINSSVTWNNRSRGGDETINYVNLFNDDILSITERSNSENNIGDSWDLNLGYTKDFAKKSQNLAVQFNHSIGGRDEKGDFYQDLLDSNGDIIADDYIYQLNESNDANTVSTIQVDYVHPVNDKLKFETGYKSIFRNIDNTFYSETNGNIDSNLNNQFLYEESIHAVYGIGSYKFDSAWSAQIGVRQEFTDYESKLVDSDSTFPNSYQPLFPSAYLNYAFDDYTNLNLSYSKRINRPSIRSLNPFTDYSNPLLLRSGNPFLMPEYIDSYELGFSKYTKKGISINPSVYYKHTTDVISRVVRTDETVVNRRIVRRENIGITDTYGMELIFSGKVKPFWRMTISGNGYWNKTNSDLEEMDLNNDALGANASFINNFTVKKNTDIQLMSWYNAPRIFALGKVKQMGSLDFAVKHKIWDGKADISFRIADVFDTQRFAIELDYFDNNTETHIKDDVIYDWESRNVFVGFSYRFGKLEQSRGRRRGGSNKGNEGNFNAGDSGGGM